MATKKLPVSGLRGNREPQVLLRAADQDVTEWKVAGHQLMARLAPEMARASVEVDAGEDQAADHAQGQGHALAVAHPTQKVGSNGTQKWIKKQIATTSESVELGASQASVLHTTH